MKIIIPTKGRVTSQFTLKNLPPELHADVILVAPEKEGWRHKANFPNVEFLAQPDPAMGIAEKRKWIVESLGFEKLVMLDDDLRFSQRRLDDTSLFVKATMDETRTAFRELREVLSEDVPHAGFSARGGGINAQAQEGGWQAGKRMMYVLGYHTPTVLANAEFGRVPTHEDMDICLQLLTKGLKNLVNFSFVVDQKFGSPGGCTDERTVESNNVDVLTLAQLHPGYVRVVEKAYLTSVSRLEVVCQWKKCLQDGELRKRTV